MENKTFFVVENEDGSFNLIVSEKTDILEVYHPQGSQSPRKFYKVTAFEPVEVKPIQENEPATETSEVSEVQ